LGAELTAWTPHTVTDTADLVHELARVRATGCAVNRGEWRLSVGGVAAVVFDAAGGPEAAVGISGPVERVLLEEEHYRHAVLDTAREISRELGCRTYPLGNGVTPSTRAGERDE
jgi:DNA-binding IclR family transcriptional regulator